MDHPFIDATVLTDDELFDAIKKCNNLLYQETHWGHTQMVDTIRASLNVYQLELDERNFRRIHDEEVRKNPDGIIELGKIEGEVIDYDEIEKKSAEIIVKRYKDL